MFTGIVESVAEVLGITDENSNRHIELKAKLDEEVYIDQSISHNGVCLTVTKIEQNEKDDEKTYSVTAIDETLIRTNLGLWKPGTKVNLERCLKAGQRMDGHFVQGHVDTPGLVKKIKDENGSWRYWISFDSKYESYLVEKGSVCINGVSLTVVDCGKDEFSVAIIPYTYEHTNFHTLQEGDKVNLEFDILGKYLHKIYRKDT